MVFVLCRSACVANKGLCQMVLKANERFIMHEWERNKIRPLLVGLNLRCMSCMSSLACVLAFFLIILRYPKALYPCLRFELKWKHEQHPLWRFSPFPLQMSTVLHLSFKSADAPGSSETVDVFFSSFPLSSVSSPPRSRDIVLKFRAKKLWIHARKRKISLFDTSLEVCSHPFY